MNALIATYRKPLAATREYLDGLDAATVCPYQPYWVARAHLLRRGLRELAASGDVEALLRYQPHAGRHGRPAAPVAAGGLKSSGRASWTSRSGRASSVSSTEEAKPSFNSEDALASVLQKVTDPGVRSDIRRMLRLIDEVEGTTAVSGYAFGRV